MNILECLFLNFFVGTLLSLISTFDSNRNYRQHIALYLYDYINEKEVWVEEAYIQCSFSTRRKTPRIYVGITIKTIYNLLFAANKLSVKSKRNIWYCPKLFKLI